MFSDKTFEARHFTVTKGKIRNREMLGEVIMRWLCVMESLCDQWVEIENRRVEKS